jgi:hypothetical protein
LNANRAVIVNAIVDRFSHDRSLSFFSSRQPTAGG